jgi:hypothetical protein
MFTGDYVLASFLNADSKGLVSNLVHCIKKGLQVVAQKIGIAASAKLPAVMLKDLIERVMRVVRYNNVPVAFHP